MATTLYLKSTTVDGGAGSTTTVCDASRAVTPGAATFYSSLDSLALSTTIGTGTGSTLQASTVAGPTAGVLVGGSAPRIWMSEPLAADVTISGTVSLRACGLESSMNANASFRYAIYRADATGALTLISNSQSTTELGTGLAARDWTASPTSTDCTKGDRITVFALIDDAGGNMGSGHTATLYFNGSNANTADSYVQFTENLTFLSSSPAGTSYYLRDTASDINPGSAVEKKLQTSQGSGTATAVHTTLNGPITFPGDQWTTTAGGSDVEWFTPQLAAFTLGGLVQVDVGYTTYIQLDYSVTPFNWLNIEIAVTNSDGTSPVVWATRALNPIYALGANPGIASYWLAGDDYSVADGKRIRLRFYSDDFLDGTNDQDSGTDQTIRYDGTSSYASRIIFTQTITEYSGAIQQSVAGGVTPSGTLSRQVRKKPAGTITPTATIKRQSRTAKAGAITPTGTAKLRPGKRPAGAITPTGTATPRAGKRVTGTITPTGSLLRRIATRVVGAITPIGAAVKRATRAVAGAIVPAGTVAPVKVALRLLTGAITPSGALVRRVGKRVSGTIAPAAILARWTGKRVAGTITPIGTLVRRITVRAAGAIAPVGTLARRIAARFTGTITPAGTLFKRATRALAGTITPVGALLRRTATRVAGAITPAGWLEAIKQADTFYQAVAGAIAPVGALARRTGKQVAGTVTPTGAAIKRTMRAVAGVIVPAGTVGAIKAFLRTVAGAITPTGTLARLPRKALAGLVTPAGAITRRTARTLAGGVIPTGAVNAAKSFFRLLTGAITPTGALVRRTGKRVVGAVTPAGIITKRVATRVVGVIVPLGVLVASLVSRFALRLVNWSSARWRVTDYSEARYHLIDRSTARYRLTNRSGPNGGS